MRNVPPREYALFQLHRKGCLDRPWRFERETATLLSQITLPETAALIADKRAFTGWMETMGLPSVPILAAPEGTFVSKPVRGVRGNSVVLWSPDGPGWRPRQGFGGREGPRRTADAIMREHGGELLQPVVEPHPDLGHPAVVRIVTHRRGSRVEVFDAAVQVPAKGDFCSHRGPFRRVDLSSGMVLPAGPGQRSILLGKPAAPMPLEGLRLPGLPGILDHLLPAHSALAPPVPLIGWDVIIGRDGPRILEANTGIALTAFQLDRLEPARVPGEEDLP